jgi:putative flippase GtrA
MSVNAFVLSIYCHMTFLLGMPPEYAFGAASGLALMPSYLTNRVWTLCTPERTLESLRRYTLGYGCRLVLQWIILYVGVRVFLFAIGGRCWLIVRRNPSTSFTGSGGFRPSYVRLTGS